MSYSDPEFLKTWKENAVFPAIHAPFANYIHMEIRGRPNFLDLGCCQGLLGRQLIHLFEGECPFVLGVDIDGKNILSGREAGVEFARCKLQVMNPLEDKKLLKAMIEDYEIETLVARRVLSEMFGIQESDKELSTEFLHALSESGIREIFIQGRQACKHPTNLLPHVRDEVALIQKYCPDAWNNSHHPPGTEFAHMWA